MCHLKIASYSANKGIQLIHNDQTKRFDEFLTDVRHLQTKQENQGTPTPDSRITPHNQHIQPMKRCYTFFSLILAAFLSSVATDAVAQSVTRSSTTMLGKGNLMPDTANTFISFSPVFMDGKTYVRWLVKNDRKDGVFIVERSALVSASPEGALFSRALRE